MTAVVWFHTVFCLIKASQEEVTMVPSFVVSKTLGEPWCEAPPFKLFMLQSSHGSWYLLLWASWDSPLLHGVAQKGS